jgi:hypothetical protein
MKTMTTLLIGVAAASLAGPARAFDGAPALPPKAAELAKAQDARKGTESALTAATQAEVDAKAKVAELEKVTVTDENKAQHATDLKAAKTAATAATKAQKAAKTADDKAAKAVTKAEVAAKAEAEKLAKAQEKAAAAAPTTPKQPEQNGITRPKADSQTGKAWAIFDEISAKNKQPASIGEALPVASAAGINEATTRTQYARWRKFNGVSGRVEAPKAPEQAAPPAPPAPPAPEVPPAPPVG